MNAPAPEVRTPPERCLSEADVCATLNRITFRPSCVDMGWAWEVLGVAANTELPFSLGWLIRTTFRRPDTDTGEIAVGFGRWWFVERGATADSVVKTAWLACAQVVEHERHEAFCVDGVRVFDPHAPLADLMAVSAARRG